jgi:sulfonate transport system substrate-binding protein
MLRTWKWPLAVVAVLVILAAGVSFYQFNRATSKTFRIGTFSTAVDYSPYYVAKSQGWLDEAAKKHGLTIEHSRYEALSAINDALAAKKLDAILEADTAAIIQKAAYIDIVGMYPLTSISQEMTVPRTSPAKKLEDLKGKKIGVLLGTGFHYGLATEIAARGLSPTDFTLVNLAPPEALSAFAAGTIDAWYVWPPFPQLEQVEGRANVFPGSSSRVNVFIFANTQFVNANDAFVVDLVAALNRAKELIKSNPDQAQAIVSKEVALPPAVVALAWPQMNFGLTVTPDVISEMNKQAAFLADGKLVAQKVEFKPDFFSKYGSKR